MMWNDIKRGFWRWVGPSGPENDSIERLEKMVERQVRVHGPEKAVFVATEEFVAANKYMRRIGALTSTFDPINGVSCEKGLCGGITVEWR